MHREMANIAACYTSANVAINAAGAATIKTTSASQIMFNGAIRSVAATSAIAFPATIASQPAGTTFTYLLTFKFSDGSARIFGPQELLDVNGTNIGNRNPTANATAIANSLPRVPNGFVVVGAVKITTDASTVFTPGTTALDASGITPTFTNLSGYPDYGITV